MGIGALAESVYRTALAHPDRTAAQIGTLLGLGEAELKNALRTLAGAGLLVRPTGEDLSEPPDLRPPQDAVLTLLREEEGRLKQRQHVLRQAQDALEDLVHDYASARSHQVEAGVELLPDATVATATLYRLARSVRRTVQSILPDDGSTSDEPSSGFHLDRDALERVPVIRTLCSQTALEATHLRHPCASLTEARAQVRTAPALPTRLLILDERTAVIPAGPHPSNGAYLINGTALVAPAAALFETIWSTARIRRPEPDEPHKRALSPQEASTSDTAAHPPSPLPPQVLDTLILLARGHKDASIARRTRVSTRSVRRRITQAMNLLHADSRCELIATAAHQGWLPPPAARPNDSGDLPHALGSRCGG
ncbi:hypothetical protein E4198_24645 [Streptomyces sp. RKND-216]|uniref:hypothetical protein n=1 Tax=Streptomyces sp. RKND-216 TaxID=2562581 RepID=UPI00109E0872|nr:hypothetical protein [Streptomyces sp. RKND-216]THA23379.1 hypothetical protein E4198_00260 [Streptomyces sp. RKND-216]THA27415.1 hypothetical protein E4198_24645 [Streptomyces sp. RKND-216]